MCSSGSSCSGSSVTAGSMSSIQARAGRGSQTAGSFSWPPASPGGHFVVWRGHRRLRYHLAGTGRGGDAVLFDQSDRIRLNHCDHGDNRFERLGVPTGLVAGLETTSSDSVATGASTLATGSVRGSQLQLLSGSSWDSTGGVSASSLVVHSLVAGCSSSAGIPTRGRDGAGGREGAEVFVGEGPAFAEGVFDAASRGSWSFFLRPKSRPMMPDFFSAIGASGPGMGRSGLAAHSRPGVRERGGWGCGGFPRQVVARFSGTHFPGGLNDYERRWGRAPRPLRLVRPRARGRATVRRRAGRTRPVLPVPTPRRRQPVRAWKARSPIRRGRRARRRR